MSWEYCEKHDTYSRTECFECQKEQEEREIKEINMSKKDIKKFVKKIVKGNFEFFKAISK